MGEEGSGMAQATAADLLFANGEAPAENVLSEVIPCQAAGDFGSAEGVETRGMSSNDNSLHERPTPYSLREG